MSRKVTVDFKFRISMEVDEGIEISHILNEFEYDFTDSTTQATILNTEMMDYEIIDSK